MNDKKKEESKKMWKKQAVIWRLDKSIRLYVQ